MIKAKELRAGDVGYVIAVIVQTAIQLFLEYFFKHKSTFVFQ